MSFVYPLFVFAAFAAFAISLLGFMRMQRIKRKILVCFVSEEMLKPLTCSVSRFKLRMKALLFSLGVALIFIALARPQYGYVLQEEKSFGLDIIFAVDTSKSMLAEDIKPNRLERSKLAINDLVDRLDSDRVGLVAFSGQAFLQCPLTLDYDAFRLSLESLDTNIIQRGGTNIAAAISEAESAFSDKGNHKILILISDGEELEASALARAQTAFKDSNIKIYALGVGSLKGESIPVRNSAGKLDFLRDSKGELVTSKLDEKLLTQISEGSGGFYAPLAGGGMDMIYDDGISKNARGELDSRMNKKAIERFQIPLALALLLLALEAVIGTRKIFGRRASGALLAAFLIPAAFSGKAKADGTDASWRGYFNGGVKAFDAGEYDKANDDFLKSLAKSYDLTEHAKSFYNMGAAEYQAARAALDLGALDETRKKSAEAAKQAMQSFMSGTQILQAGKQTLERYGEEGLKNQQLQQQIKQAVSVNEAAKKSLDENAKPIKEAESSLGKVLKMAESARKNFTNAAELDPRMENADIAEKNASAAKEKIAGIAEEIRDLDKAALEQSKKLSELIEELKKLLREEENQDKNQKDQNQDQQQQDKDNNQKQDSKENPQDGSKDEQNKNQEDSGDKNEQQKDQSSKENSQQDKSSNKEDDDEAQKSQEQAANEQKQDNQNNTDADSGTEENDEQAADKAEREDISDNGPEGQEEATGPMEKPDEEDTQAGQDFRAADGAMTRREAGQVLDTLKDSEKKLPFSGYGNQQRRFEEKNYKDW